MKDLMFSFDGRISRRRFWLGLLVFLVAGVLISLPFARIAPAAGPVVRLVLFVLSLVLLVPIAALATKRLHDRDREGRPRVHLLLGAITLSGLIQTMQIGYVPRRLLAQEIMMPGAAATLALFLCSAVSIWIMIGLGFRDGTRGPNRFGPDPRGPRETTKAG